MKYEKRGIGIPMQSFSRLTIRQLCVAAACALMGACSYLPPEIVPVQPDSAPAKLLGITDLAPESNQWRILFIHGMGLATECEADNLLIHLTKVLQVNQEPIGIDPVPSPCVFALPKATQIRVKNAHHTALLYHYYFAGDNRQVSFMYLRWSTLTEVPKETLIEPSFVSPPVEPYPHVHRAILSDTIKDFEDNYLSDVLLYAGKYRDVLRPAVQQGLCIFVGGTPNPDNPRVCPDAKPNIPTAIITHSMGAYMLMDALNDIYRRPGLGFVPEKKNAAVAVGCYLNQVYFLANQLKMLDLTTRRFEEQQSSEVFNNFRSNWDLIQTTERCPEHDRSSRQVLAISDPNDILSWQVTKSDINTPKITVANIYLGTTGEVFGFDHTPIFGVAALPDKAHTNYLVDDDVMDIVACGMTGATINHCSP
jgi:hypothetical protein